MDMRFTSKNQAKSIDYLKIEYNSHLYNLEQFSALGSSSKELEQLIQKSNLIYNDRKLSYVEYESSIEDFAKKLEILNVYSTLDAKQINMIDVDYCYSIKLIKSLEEYLMYGRYSLIKGFTILDYDCNLYWSGGYCGVYAVRGISIRNAILNYNNCYDILMQVVFIAFGLYKNHPNYTSKTNIEEVLNWCDYKYLASIYSRFKGIPNFKELWKLMTEGWESISKVRCWANDLKHKKNIVFDGEYIQPLFKKVVIRRSDGEKLDYSKFEPETLNMESVINDLVKTHTEFISLSRRIIRFINYDSCVLHPYKTGFSLPEKESYKKVIVPNSVVPPKKEIDIIAVPLIFNEKGDILLRKDNGGFCSIPSSSVGFDHSIFETIKNIVYTSTGIETEEYLLISIIHFDNNKKKEKQLCFCYKVSYLTCIVIQNKDDDYKYYWSSIEQAKKQLFSEKDKCCLEEIDNGKLCEKHIIMKKDKVSNTECYNFLA